MKYAEAMTILGASDRKFAMQFEWDGGHWLTNGAVACRLDKATRARGVGAISMDGDKEKAFEKSIAGMKPCVRSSTETRGIRLLVTAVGNAVVDSFYVRAIESVLPSAQWFGGRTRKHAVAAHAYGAAQVYIMGVVQ